MSRMPPDAKSNLDESDKFEVGRLYYRMHLVSKKTDQHHLVAPFVDTWRYMGLINTTELPNYTCGEREVFAFARYDGSRKSSESKVACFRDRQTAEGMMLTLEELIAKLSFELRRSTDCHENST